MSSSDETSEMPDDGGLSMGGALEPASIERHPEEKKGGMKEGMKVDGVFSDSPTSGIIT